MKFFSTSQIRQLDEYTIEHEPINSIDLMERAAQAIFNQYIQNFDKSSLVCIMAGPGNNGGDALALARMLLQKGFSAEPFLLHTGKLSPDCEKNRQRLLKQFPNTLTELKNEFTAPDITKKTVIIDGLFGSGLTRPLGGIFAEAVKWINNSQCKVMAIDIPSGLQGDENANLTVPIVNANFTFSLQFPKLAFLLPDSASFAGQWEVLDIGIHPKAIAETESMFYFLDKTEIKQIIKTRTKFSHKGTFGHLLILAGSNGMAGAAILSTKTALRSGAGLITVHSAECNREIMQTSIPEAIFHSDKNQNIITEFPDLKNYNAIAIGPGIGTKPETTAMLGELLSKLTSPCVLDADALNIISKHPEMLQQIPAESIITPHPKEFERLFGTSKNSYDRMQKASEMAKKHKVIIVLKGAHTLIAQPDGKLYFNSTGNSGMATAGAGDVLTGILGGLLAQGYPPENAAKIGVYLHGLSGDLALEKQTEETMMARDIIEYLGSAFNTLK